MRLDNLSFNPDYLRALDYFKAKPKYEPTPLISIEPEIGISLLAKDETNRMGLGAFKALGGPYAMAQIIAQNWKNETGESLNADRYADPDIKAFAAEQTFICASAGNHGMGVAAGAKALGAQARIYLADTVPDSFDARLTYFGAKVVRSGSTYEDSIAAAIDSANRNNHILLQDGTWPGYTEIPKLIMEGYTVIAEELRQSFQETENWPSHVYLQAGVGGLAAALAWMIRHNWELQPEILVVEPDHATCLADSHKAGKPIRSNGPESNMGRLDCKEPSIIAWQVLEACNVRYLSLSESEGLEAARIVTETGIPTTSSGAAGYGGLLKQFNSGPVSENFKPLIIVTEGVV